MVWLTGQSPAQCRPLFLLLSEEAEAQKGLMIHPGSSREGESGKGQETKVFHSKHRTFFSLAGRFPS